MSSIYRRTILALAVVSASVYVIPALSQQLETTSGLGRKLYALPDSPAIEAARAELAKDPQNVALVLKLSKAQAVSDSTKKPS